MSPPELLAVGRIAKAHGVRGEVSVQPLTEVEDRFAPGSVLLLGPDGSERLTVAAARPHTGRLLITFEEIPDRTAAEAVRGRLLLADAATSPERPEGSFWAHEVVGLEVITDEGRALGPVTEILHSAANDVWVTSDGSLIPALADVVLSVDLEERRVTVRAVPGLLDDEEPS